MWIPIASSVVSLYLVALCDGVKILNLDRAATLRLSESNSSRISRSAPLRTPRVYPVNCFNPYTTLLQKVEEEDCDVVINQIILHYPNPMEIQSWGYLDSVDIDLRLIENKQWRYGSCVIYVTNEIERGMDRFRVVDVAATARRIVTECVVEPKYQIGGTADLGSKVNYFYVGIGGLPELQIANHTIQ